jgi:hypothetical protein
MKNKKRLVEGFLFNLFGKKDKITYDSIMKNTPKDKLVGPVKESKVNMLERKLDRIFPEQFREFLLEYGGGKIYNGSYLLEIEGFQENGNALLSTMKYFNSTPNVIPPREEILPFSQGRSLSYYALVCENFNNFKVGNIVTYKYYDQHNTYSLLAKSFKEFVVQQLT